MAITPVIQPLACPSGTGIVESGDEYCGLEYEDEENYTCHLPLIPDEILSVEPDVKLVQQLDPVTLFSLVQTLANKFRTMVETRTSVELSIDQKYDHNFVQKCSNRLRSHERETFINISEIVGLAYPTQTCTKDLFDSMKKNEEYDDAVNKFMESSNFMVSDDAHMDIKNLDEATGKLRDLICVDGGLAYPVCYNVVERLVQIFVYKEIQFLQYRTACILFSAMYHECSELINKRAIPVLVEVINHSLNQVAERVAMTLTRLACESSYHVSYIVSDGALEAVREFVSNSSKGAFYVVHSLAVLLAAVCRTTTLSLDKEKVVITISQTLFNKKWYTPSTIHIKLACYTLSYLSYGKPAAITNEVCETVVKLLSHDDDSVVASALGVVGNIVRWGHGYQIQFLTEHCRLVQCLGERVLCSKLKKLQKEACQIISNLAVGSKTSIKNEADLIESVCKLVEKEECDVKMEAAWAIFNGIYA